MYISVINFNLCSTRATSVCVRPIIFTVIIIIIIITIIITIVNIISNRREALRNVRGSYSETETPVGYIHIYISVGVRCDVIKLQTWSIVFATVFLVWRSSNAFGDEFRPQTYSTENIEAIWVISLKARGKIAIKEHLPVRLSFPLSTVRLFIVRILLSFSLKTTFEFMLRRSKLIINLALSPPMDQRLVSAPYIGRPFDPIWMQTYIFFKRIFFVCFVFSCGDKML